MRVGNLFAVIPVSLLCACSSIPTVSTAGGWWNNIVASVRPVEQVSATRSTPQVDAATVSHSRRERAIIQAVRAAVRAVPGVDPALLVAVAARESSLDCDAINLVSGTGGLFQFSDDTWLEAVRRHAGKHGHADLARAISIRAGVLSVSPAARQRIMAMRRVPVFSTVIAAEMLADARGDAEQALGRPAKYADIYAIHAKGTGGGTAFLRGVAAGRNKAEYRSLVDDIERRHLQARQLLDTRGQAVIEVAMAPGIPGQRMSIVDKSRRVGYQ